MNGLIKDKLKALHRTRGWTLLTGALCVLLGVFGLMAPVVLSLTTAMLIGVILTVTGSVMFLYALVARGWGAGRSTALGGFLAGVVGILILTHMDVAVRLASIAVGVVFLVSGVERLLSGWTMRPHSAWWLGVLEGGLSFLLGLFLLLQWPYSGLWWVGILVAIRVLLIGMVLLTLGWMVRKSHQP